MIYIYQIIRLHILYTSGKKCHSLKYYILLNIQFNIFQLNLLLYLIYHINYTEILYKIFRYYEFM